MNLNYDKIKAKSESGGSQWTSYSDLFMVLSVVFLLLYTVASLRNGTMALTSQIEVQKAKEELEILKDQVKVYDVLREDYLDDGASKKDKALYKELMSKMTLLEEESKKAKQDAAVKFKDAKTKESELNKYQKLIKNIVNANLVAQSRLKKRDEIIKDQDANIEALSNEMVMKQSEIEANNLEIKKTEKELEEKIKEAQYAYRSRTRAKKKLSKVIERIKAESKLKISKLEEQNADAEMSLNSVKSKLKGVKNELKNKDTELVKTNQELIKTQKQTQSLLGALQAKEKSFQKRINAAWSSHQKELENEREKFYASLNRQKLSAKAKLQKEREYAAAIKEKNEAYDVKVSSLNSLLRKNKGEIAKQEEELAATKSLASESQRKNLEYGKKVANLSSELKRTTKDLSIKESELAASQRQARQRSDIAKKIRKNFARAGIDAGIDPKTGDVTVNFGKEYFRTGSSNLKSKMKSIMKRVVPVYAKSIFENQALAKRISTVEIVGFASPTYKGRYVRPDSLSQSDKKAINYNMDLSYGRAKSIFQYIFDTKKMVFPEQKRLLPLVKVTGRSYLAEQKSSRNVSSDAGLSDDQYCKKFDCNKSQKVVIRFNLTNK